MTLHPSDCTTAFAAYCPVCRWDGPESDTVTDVVLDCHEHNRKRRHKINRHGYAHVRVVHHHPTPAGVAT